MIARASGFCWRCALPTSPWRSRGPAGQCLMYSKYEPTKKTAPARYPTSIEPTNQLAFVSSVAAELGRGAAIGGPPLPLDRTAEDRFSGARRLAVACSQLFEIESAATGVASRSASAPSVIWAKPVSMPLEVPQPMLAR
jgi:hypothetical protein